MIDRQQRRKLIACIALGCLIALPTSVGCGSSKPVGPSTVDEAHLKVLGILYGKFLGSTRGRAPKDQQQFVNYLNSKRPSWEKIVDSPQQLLTSPRDGKPFVVLYGEAYRRQPNSVTPWMAHEQEGLDGKQQVISIRGSVKEMDSAEVASLFSVEGK